MSCQKGRCFFTERCDKIIFVLLNPLPQKNWELIIKMQIAEKIVTYE